MSGSVREYAILWTGGIRTPGGSTVGGGSVLTSTPVHALDGPEHAAASDVTRLDASTDAHGLLPRLSGDAGDRLDGTGAWAPEADPVALAALSAHLSDAVDAHDASAIGYDHTASGLAASDVQAAIDELESAAPSPASTVTGPDAFGDPAVVGTSADYARADHDHGLPAASGSTGNLDGGTPSTTYGGTTAIDGGTP